MRESDNPGLLTDSYYHWLNEPVEGSGGAITRLWHAVYTTRADLQQALGLGATVVEFGDPFRTSGPHSYFSWLTHEHPEAIADGPSAQASGA